MRSPSTPNGPSGEKFTGLSPKIRTIFFSVPFLISLNSLILGGFISYLLLNFQPGPIPVLAAVPHTSSVLTSRMTTTPTPEPSRTPFLYLAPTSTPTATPVPTSTPAPTLALPEEARVYGISGHRQSMPLSCESRSAVDWAAFLVRPLMNMHFTTVSLSMTIRIRVLLAAFTAAGAKLLPNHMVFTRNPSLKDSGNMD